MVKYNVAKKPARKPYEYITEKDIWRDNRASGEKTNISFNWEVISMADGKLKYPIKYAVYASPEKAQLIANIYNELKEQKKVTSEGLVRLIRDAETDMQNKGGHLVGYIELEGKIGIVHSSKVLQFRYSVHEDDASAETTPSGSVNLSGTTKHDISKTLHGTYQSPVKQTGSFQRQLRQRNSTQTPDSKTAAEDALRKSGFIR